MHRDDRAKSTVLISVTPEHHAVLADERLRYRLLVTLARFGAEGNLKSASPYIERSITYGVRMSWKLPGKFTTAIALRVLGNFVNFFMPSTISDRTGS